VAFKALDDIFGPPCRHLLYPVGLGLLCNLAVSAPCHPPPSWHDALLSQRHGFRSGHAGFDDVKTFPVRVRRCRGDPALVELTDSGQQGRVRVLGLCPRDGSTLQELQRGQKRLHSDNLLLHLLHFAPPVPSLTPSRHDLRCHQLAKLRKFYGSRFVIVDLFDPFLHLRGESESTPQHSHTQRLSHLGHCHL